MHCFITSIGWLGILTSKPHFQIQIACNLFQTGAERALILREAP